ncbi:hypothetical protein VO178_15650 [Lysinibacillus fusiformis]|uniref:hypothetical protein n=1 Tax=Lysinibacillus fusiformis TaxID=28031 RepID=UPI002D79E5DA|nr:hypothetical protein [Lysinibacillus fusiformis]WRS96797.1 hypothetical protein VO178_15650 [Lysinibacillus fusiformis]
MTRESVNHFMNDPWWLISKCISESLNDELKKELSQQHILYGKKAIVVARREDNDDVIFWIETMNKYAVVHLTYSKETTSEYPVTSLYTRRELEERSFKFYYHDIYNYGNIKEGLFNEL